jgi:hypothetical protein
MGGSQQSGNPTFSHQEENSMKKLLAACVICVAAIAPAVASAADPSPADFKNAAKFCKAFRAASGSNFATMFGTKKNAYGKCVSATAKQTANEDAAQQQAARTNAAKQCKAERDDAGFAAAHGGKTFEQFYGTHNGSNAYGKCVSQKAKAQKSEADAEDEAQEGDRLNAAQTCKKAKREDPAKFGQDFGTRRNAFGKCVSRTAKEFAAARHEEESAPTT